MFTVLNGSVPNCCSCAIFLFRRGLDSLTSGINWFCSWGKWQPHKETWRKSADRHADEFIILLMLSVRQGRKLLLCGVGFVNLRSVRFIPDAMSWTRRSFFACHIPLFVGSLRSFLGAPFCATNQKHPVKGVFGFIILSTS